LLAMLKNATKINAGTRKNSKRNALFFLKNENTKYKINAKSKISKIVIAKFSVNALCIFSIKFSKGLIL